MQILLNEIRGYFSKVPYSWRVPRPLPTWQRLYKTEALWWLEQRCLEQRREKCISKSKANKLCEKFLLPHLLLLLNPYLIFGMVTVCWCFSTLTVFCFFLVCVIQDSLLLNHVAVPSGSQPAGRHSLQLERLPSQACQSTRRSATWGAQQILFSAETLHQSDYKTKVCTQISAGTQRVAKKNKTWDFKKCNEWTTMWCAWCVCCTGMVKEKLLIL